MTKKGVEEQHPSDMSWDENVTNVTGIPRIVEEQHPSDMSWDGGGWKKWDYWTGDG